MLLGVRPCVMRDVPRVEWLRCVGEGVSFREEWIAEAISAATGRHRLTLRQSIKTAGDDRRGHVLAAVFVRRAGVAAAVKATKPRANNAAAGVALILKNCFILLSHFCCLSVAGLSGSRSKWDAVVRRAMRAWLTRSQICYLFARGFNHRCAVCRKETES